MTPFPNDFVRQCRAFMDDELWAKVSRGLDDVPPVSIRLNQLKCDERGWGVANDDGQIPWCNGGWFLSSRPTFTFDPLLHGGMYYVQEASSMFLDAVLRQYVGEEPIRALDLCAAPGGKSAIARAVLPEGSLLFCNEPIRLRAQVLAENMMKQGHKDVIVTSNFAADYARSQLQFDVIIADVPCSGEGMFRKDETARSEWSLQNVDKCWRLQREIVKDVWPCLKDGGLLVYSTCTLNLKENELNVQYIKEELGADVVPVQSSQWCSSLTGSLLSDADFPVYRFLPGVSRGEGLFMAVLRKRGDCIATCERKADKKRKNERQRTKNDGAADACLRWLNNPNGFDVVSIGDTFSAIPKAWRGVYDEANKALKVITAGVPLGETKGKDFVPAYGLALSAAFDSAMFPKAELTYSQAISYLRKESITLNADMPRGYVVVTFRGVPLGFVKNVGNRANNLYPQEWKIRSTHVPSEYEEVITPKQK